jgi:hypothetical protein
MSNERVPHPMKMFENADKCLKMSLATGVGTETQGIVSA